MPPSPLCPCAQEYEASKERVIFLVDCSPPMLEPCEVDEGETPEEDKVGRQSPTAKLRIRFES
jgi:hypothetical protein